VIGQACEFDYSGTQACKALREEGYEVVLVNSNPATIMTDPEFASATYVEPVTPEVTRRIIEKERPDALLPTMGGQTALNVAVALADPACAFVTLGGSALALPLARVDEQVSSFLVFEREDTHTWTGDEHQGLDVLGSCRKLTVTSEKTLVVEGSGRPSDVQARIGQIRQGIETTTSDYDREKLQERLAKLAGGVAQINVGAATEVEMKEKKARVEDALHATRAAVEEGIVPGGGVTLLRAANVIDKLGLKDEEAVGAQIVKRALEEPVRTIAANAGAEGSVIVERLRSEKAGVGYDASMGKFVDMFSKGIVDPSSVDIPRSIDALMMVLIGGVHTLVGPLVGSLTFVVLEDRLSAFEFWRAIFGGLIIAICVAMPGGIAGTCRRLFDRWSGIEAGR